MSEHHTHHIHEQAVAGNIGVAFFTNLFNTVIEILGLDFTNLILLEAINKSDCINKIVCGR